MEIIDKLDNNIPLDERRAQVLWILLSHFSRAEPKEKIGKLVNFRDLPGGYAYDYAFTYRAVKPISGTFGEEPTRLIETGKTLGGNIRFFGEVSVEIPPCH